MFKRLASTGACSSVSLATARRLSIVFAVVFSIIVNGFVPRFSLTLENREVLSQIMVGQSTLLKFFSLSTVPLNIVEEIFSDMTATPLSTEKKSPSRSKNSLPMTSTDSITVPQTGLFGLRAGLERSGVGHPCFSLACFDRHFTESNTANSIANHPLAGMLTIFILFFFLLPRSSVSEDAAIIYHKVANSTQLENSSWVFYLSKNTIFTGRVS